MRWLLGTLMGTVPDVSVDPAGHMEAQVNIRRDFYQLVVRVGSLVAAPATVAREPGAGKEAGEGVPFTEGFGEVSTVGLYPIARGQPMA